MGDAWDRAVKDEMEPSGNWDRSNFNAYPDSPVTRADLAVAIEEIKKLKKQVGIVMGMLMKMRKQ